MCHVPEGVGEPEVVADEQAQPQAVDGHRHRCVARPVGLVFVGVGERVELVVVVATAARAHQQKPVSWQGARIVVDVTGGDRTAYPDPMGLGLAGHELFGRTT